MEHVLSELEKKVERVASAIKRLKEENATLRAENRRLGEGLRELQKGGSGSDGVVKELRNKVTQLEGERKSLIDLRKKVETRLEAILSQFETFEE